MTVTGPKLPDFIRLRGNASQGEYAHQFLPQAQSRRELILSSLRSVFGTRKGERLMNPNFGCDINQLAFETFSDDIGIIGVDMIREAVTSFEPRVLVLDVGFSESKTSALVSWHVTLKDKQNPDDVFRFQLNTQINA